VQAQPHFFTAPEETTSPPRRGRPPGSKNKPKDGTDAG
jgi:hypothetical protein